MGRGSSSRSAVSASIKAQKQAQKNQQTQMDAAKNTGGGMFSGSDDQIQAQFMAMDNQQLATLMGGLPSNSHMISEGLNTNELNKVTYMLGMNEKPTVLDNASWDKAVKTDALDGVHMWRGVTGNSRRNISASDVTENLKGGEKTFHGNGIHGDGLYFTTKFGYAQRYSDGTKNSISKAFIDKSKAKVVKESKIRNMQGKESRFSEAARMDISTYALYKGYNVIHVPGGNSGASHSKSNGGQDFYVALTRSVLTVRQTSK